MFYDPHTKSSGLPRDPFKSCLVPRPIGWISTLSRDGVVNLAPYSFFNGVSSSPPVVMFSSNGPGPAGGKDSRRNCEETGEFVVNLATWDLREQVNATSAAFSPEVDELAEVGLTPAPARLVRPPRVLESPIHLECTYLKTVDLPGDDNALVLGEVVGVHIDERVLTGGLVDMAKLRPIARLGYMDYCVVDEVFSMQRPKV